MTIISATLFIIGTIVLALGIKLLFSTGAALALIGFVSLLASIMVLIIDED